MQTHAWNLWVPQITGAKPYAFRTYRARAYIGRATSAGSRERIMIISGDSAGVRDAELGGTMELYHFAPRDACRKACACRDPNLRGVDEPLSLDEGPRFRIRSRSRERSEYELRA